MRLSGEAGEISQAQPPDLMVSAMDRAALRDVHGLNPVPVSRLKTLLSEPVAEDPGLETAKSASQYDGESLNNPFLAGLLRGHELGYWSAGADALNLLERHIQTLRPKTVLEFGSGISTVCLARYMWELHGDARRTLVYSLEQDHAFLKRTKLLLADASLKKRVRLILAPLTAERTSVGPVRLKPRTRRKLSSDQPDFLFIDGPAGKSGVRLQTLPMVLPLLAPDAHFFLDDALRGSELEAADSWAGIDGACLDGVYLTNKGLLVGHLTHGSP